MLDIIIKALQTTSAETIVLAASIVLIIWVYKEVKNNYTDSEKFNLERMNKALEIYGELAIEIQRFLNKKSDCAQIENKLVKAYSFLPKILLEKFIEWQIQGNDEILTKLHKKLNAEIFRIKRKQKDPVTYNIENSTFGAIESLFYNAKISLFIQPLKLLLGLLFVLFIGVITIYSVSEADIKGKIYICFAVVNIGFYFMEFMLFADILSEKRFIHSLKNWLLVVAFIVVPGISLLFTQWYLAIIGTILFWVYTIVFSPKSLRRIEF